VPDAKTANGRPSQDMIRTYVERVQIALTFKGYDPGPVDGRLGQKTKKALKQFQADSSLTPTGNMDVATLRMLGVIK
jgi:peptidoglycan hydrolase-like protein with peptidoglycan-binding domain